jgi:hypothetical protein
VVRRYDDPIEVRKGVLAGADLGSGEAPEQFLWHGRLWKVRDVLAHWVETGAWWQSAGARAALGTDGPDSGERTLADLGADLLAEREVWRVEAGTGPLAEGGRGGVFELSFTWSDGTWQLLGCLD